MCTQEQINKVNEMDKEGVRLRHIGATVGLPIKVIKQILLGEITSGEPASKQEPKPNPRRSISIIIPYMHTEDREPLLYACLRTLPQSTKKLKIEVCIHEIGTQKKLDESLLQADKYLFTKYDGAFHRAWALNVAVKTMAKYSTLVLMDGDLIITDAWKKELITAGGPSIAWGEMRYLTKKDTDYYLKTGLLQPNIKTWAERGIRKPAVYGAAGGITLLHRNTFFEVSGVPEDFKGIWGGNDNTFMAKIRRYGYRLQPMRSKIYHMYHSKNRPPTNEALQNLAKRMLRYDRNEWIAHTKKCKEWGIGDPNSNIICLPR